MSELKLFTMKADEDLLTMFKAVCDANDVTASQMVRQFMREYIAKNPQPDLLKGLPNADR